ncbi:MAG: hypothetical protein FWC39_04710 [Bacteroidetes bacterium]|nr:hypothetical protein [Bacteroidota bacterium]
MKKILYILFLIISVNAVAQPGYSFAEIRAMSEKYFQEINEQLEKDPNNLELIWERVKMEFEYQLDIKTKPENFKNKIFHYENPTDLFSDLTKLIDNNFVTHSTYETHNIAEFLLLRGRAYYFSGEMDKALQDYLLALNYVNSQHITDDINLSIAAYYYNLEENLTAENARQALKYVNLLARNSCSNQIADCYEQEKIDLLKFLGDDEELENYYKELIYRTYNIFVRYNSDHFLKKDTYFSTLLKVNDLANFYYETENYERAKYLAEQALKFFEDNNHNANFWNAAEHYLLMNKIFQLEVYRNFDAEMNNIVKLAYFNHGSYVEESYIKKRLQENPQEARLYLALAIWHSRQRERNISDDEIFNLLEKAEQLKLVDYRIPLLKAGIYGLQKNYELALKEIDNAIQLAPENVNLYWEKYQLLQRYNWSIPNPDWEKVTEVEQIAKRKNVDNNKDFPNISELINSIKNL